MKKIIGDLTAMISSMMDQIKFSKSSPSNKYSPKDQDTTTVVPYNNKASSLESVNYKNIDFMRTLKHEISSSKFYKLLIKAELKGYTAMDLKNFYSHIKMCPNAVTRLREYVLSD